MLREELSAYGTSPRIVLLSNYFQHMGFTKLGNGLVKVDKVKRYFLFLVSWSISLPSILPSSLEHM